MVMVLRTRAKPQVTPPPSPSPSPSPSSSPSPSLSPSPENLRPRRSTAWKSNSDGRLKPKSKKKPGRKPKKKVEPAFTESTGISSEYESVRERTIRENRERMEMLGIFNLSQRFKPKAPKRLTKSYPKRKSSDYSRRSSRLTSVGRVNYTENERYLKDEGIFVPAEGTPEVYTEEDKKLLGDCEKAWTLFVDGYEEDGERAYDPLNGTTCHHCRQKTAGHHSFCHKCKLPQGQLCGDCLYMRYGENVLEVNENLNWICPVCRGICNCSRCRRAKGWTPTVLQYSKVIELGYKSVAHYLILGRNSVKKLEDSKGENTAAAELTDVPPSADQDVQLLGGSSDEWSNEPEPESDSDDSNED